MSYSRTYSGVVRISGTKYVSYPASEHGGTMSVSYEDSETVNVNIHVDTEPFDHSINGTNHALAGVSAAVGTLQGAQIASLHKFGQRVSQSAINGFFRVIGNDISQEITANRNKTNTSLALLQQQSDDLASVHAQMDGDYRHISSRYQNVFRNLDEECRKRVVELDRVSFQIAEQIKQKLLYQKLEDSAVPAYDTLAETEMPTIMLSGARVNKKTQTVLSRMKQSIEKTNAFAARSGKMCGGSACENQENIYIPVVYIQTTDGDGQEKEISCHSAESDAGAVSCQGVFDELSSAPISAWKEINHTDSEQIDDFFRRQAEEFAREHSDNDRVYREMMRLYQSGKPKTIYR